MRLLWSRCFCLISMEGRHAKVNLDYLKSEVGYISEGLIPEQSLDLVYGPPEMKWTKKRAERRSSADWYIWATKQQGILGNHSGLNSISSALCRPEKEWWLNWLSTWVMSESPGNTHFREYPRRHLQEGLTEQGRSTLNVIGTLPWAGNSGSLKRMKRRVCELSTSFFSLCICFLIVDAVWSVTLYSLCHAFPAILGCKSCFS